MSRLLITFLGDNIKNSKKHLTNTIQNMKIGTTTLDNATIIENTISGLIVLFVSLLFTILWWVIKNNYTTIIIWIKRQKLKFFPPILTSLFRLSLNKD